ncbi:MAG: NAD(P)/FAD-dependent oxidoreductase [Bacteroidota bacterium]
MNKNKSKHIAIIGNGISGITAARHIRKLSDHQITVISAETDHFFSRTALMYIYMGHMKYEHTKPFEDWFWKKNRIDLKKAYVQNIEFDDRKIHCDDGTELLYDELILAVGSKPNKFGWPGQDLPGVQGLYSYQDLELLERNTHPYGTKGSKIKRAVLVGGGLIGIELAEMLLTRNIEVTFLVRENSFWSSVLPKGDSELISRHILDHHIDLRRNTELKEIIAGEDGRACAVMTNTGERIYCQLVGLTAGVSPNIEFLKSTSLELGRGIKVNPFLETNIEHVYAIGDCAEQHKGINGRKPIEAVWYTGRMMGETVAQTICKERTAYNPGNWFNSAKFLDIEYHTYGWVFNKPREGEKHFFWEHKDGDKCMTINFLEDDMRFIGINTFGIRMRHEIFDQWLNEERDVLHVLAHLKDANFDPEFYRTFEEEIVAKFNEENITNIRVQKRSWKRIFTNA